MNGVPCLGTALLQQELFWKTYRATENQPGRAVANGCSADFSKFKQGCNFFRTLLMLSYSYLPSKGLAVFYKWEGSQAQKAGEVQLSKHPLPHLSVLDLPDSSGRGNNSLSHTGTTLSATATCLVKARTIAKKAHFHTAKNTE